MNRYVKLLFLALIMMTNIHFAFSQNGNARREPAVAGSFYPADADTLRAEVDGFLDAAQAEGTDGVQAVIVPHAGYVFSGATAAEAFARIDPATRYKRVFLLGPSHRASFDGASVDVACGRYATPLGELEVDLAACRALMEADSVFAHVPRAHEQEHCLEVELPFLQERLREVPPLVPVIIGTTDYAKLRRIAAALRPYFTPDNLFVVSSDFSHYPSYEDAVEADRATGDAILSASPDAFLEAIADNASRRVPRLLTSACGQAPIAVLLMLVQQAGGLQMEHLAYCNSGDSPYGGRDRVVGYHAFAVTRVAGQAFTLSDEEKSFLLQTARRSIEGALSGDSVSCDTSRLTDKLRMDCGAFVTLHKHGKLRGCIGRLVGVRPLYLTVAEMARAAAFEDPRFRPVRAEELPDIRIDISVLSPLKRIHSADELQLGRHGIFIVKGVHQGTFLPQVARETHWTKEEFLGHCARDKAGLSWDGWHDAELYVYEAEVFDEDEDR